MSANEIRKAVSEGEELVFSHKGREYLVYGWNQCDGYILSLECGGELVWQSPPMSKSACTDAFLSYYSEL